MKKMLVSAIRNLLAPLFAGEVGLYRVYIEDSGPACQCCKGMKLYNSIKCSECGRTLVRRYAKPAQPVKALPCNFNSEF